MRLLLTIYLLGKTSVLIQNQIFWNFEHPYCGVLIKNVLIPVSDEDIFAQEARVKEARQKLAMAVKALG